MTIGGAWVKHDKNGNKYLSCSINFFSLKLHFSLFENTPREGETLSPNAPNYKIVTFDGDQK